MLAMQILHTDFKRDKKFYDDAESYVEGKLVKDFYRGLD